MKVSRPANIPLTCDICTETRPWNKIAARHIDVGEAMGIEKGNAWRNVLYCNDRQSCIKWVTQAVYVSPIGMRLDCGGGHLARLGTDKESDNGEANKVRPTGTQAGTQRNEEGGNKSAGEDHPAAQRRT